MSDLPPELEPHRDELLVSVKSRGRAMRRRRIAAVSGALALVLLVPVVTFAMVRADNGPSRVEANGTAPETEATTTTSVAPVPTSPPSTVTTTVPIAPPPTEPLTPTTTALVCHNSTNPACGPMYYDPPLTNAPATVTVTTSPAVPHVGDKVVFTLHVTDPDSFIPSGPPCMGYSFGEGVDGDCGASCSSGGEQYGAWDPPPPRPGDATFTMEHVYPKAGVYEAKFTVRPGECSARPSPVTRTVRMAIAP
jgi:hypothetical protein